MKKITYKNTSFVTSAVANSDFPTFHKLPEIAVLGRSNVGKSSLLNDLFQAKNLVKTSSTPGKTQALNFFNVDGKLIFVDLPGYGFAKTPLEQKKIWGKTIEGYLRLREELKLYLLLLDIRHLPSEQDVQMYTWLRESNMPFLIVFTKIDKVTSAEMHAQTKKILKTLNSEHVPYVHYSVTKKTGRIDLIRLIEEALA